MHDVGAKVHKLKHLKLHGKMLLADDKRAIVGSINLTPGSFDARRELAVETDFKHVVKRLVKTSRHDWKNSRKLDLSDEGILADFEKHGTKGAEMLAIKSEEEASSLIPDVARQLAKTALSELLLLEGNPFAFLPRDHHLSDNRYSLGPPFFNPSNITKTSTTFSCCDKTTMASAFTCGASANALRVPTSWSLRP